MAAEGIDRVGTDGVAGAISADRRGGFANVASLPGPLTKVAWSALAAIVILGFVIFAGHGARTGVLYILGVLLGGVLFHSRFGFTSAFRQMVSVGQGRGLRAHMLMLAVASLLFAPILASGFGFFGVVPKPNVEPVGISLIVGSFLFGMGMQLGGACASGTLFSIGSGQTAIVLTLGGFIVGSVLGAWNWGFWTQDLPALPPISLADTGLGYGGALIVQLLAFGLIALATLAIARRRRPPVVEQPPAASGIARMVRGSWPLWVGAIVLALLNAITLTVKGSPWGITSAFALWGSWVWDLVGGDPGSWVYWGGSRAEDLRMPILSHSTSVMDIGIILGALLASSIGGTFVLHRRVPWKTALAAVVGGIIMGYGARLAFGCNIGSYFSGIASFSLHGWVWGAMAIIGTYAGLLLRPLFGLANPKPTDSVC